MTSQRSGGRFYWPTGILEYAWLNNHHAFDCCLCYFHYIYWFQVSRDLVSGFRAARLLISRFRAAELLVSGFKIQSSEAAGFRFQDSGQRGCWFQDSGFRFQGCYATGTEFCGIISALIEGIKYPPQIIFQCSLDGSRLAIPLATPSLHHLKVRSY